MADTAVLRPAMRGGFEASPRARLLPYGWALLAMFTLYPVWWALGLGAFIWPLLSIPLAAHVVVSRGWLAPRGFVTWLLFLMWTVISAIQLTSAENWMTYLFRLSSYASATIIFLYILNVSEERLPTERIVHALALLWVFVVVGGFLGLALPHVSFSTPVEQLLPRSFLANRWLRDLVHPAFAQNFGERALEVNGRPVIRPTAPFAYANWWGGNFVILLPFVLVACRTLASHVLRWLLVAILVASTIPFIQSANRGAWLSLVIGLAYAVVRLAAQGNRRGSALLLGLIVVTSAVVVATPLNDLIRGRLDAPGSAELRVSLYEQATDAAAGSPLVGYGVPLPPPHSAYVLPNVGTQGQLWLVLVSAGVPALVLFVGWMLYVALASRGLRDVVGFAAHVGVVMALIQLPVYGMVPVELQIFMVAAALVWRRAPRLRGPIQPIVQVPPAQRSRAS